ncbi:MAG: hypothetical protein ACXWV9_08070 [Flavisolibacter sp.]
MKHLKTGLIFTLIPLILLVVFFSKANLYIGQTTMQIEIYDTYYVMSFIYFIGFLILFLGSFFFLGASVGTRFNNKYFFIPLLIFVAIDIYYGIDLFRMLT